MEQENTPETDIKYLDPLRSKIPSIDFNNPLYRRCIDIITEARLMWKYSSIPVGLDEVIDGKIVPKKKSFFLNNTIRAAMEICDWYQKKSLLFLRSGFQVDNVLLKTSIGDCRENIKAENITEQEILAIFSICEAFEAVNDMQHKKPEEDIKEKVYAASTFLKLAKTGIEPEKQNRVKKDGFILFPTPPGSQWHEIELSFIDGETVRISVKGNKQTKHFIEMGFRKGNTCNPIKPVGAWYILLHFKENKSLKFSQRDKSKIEKGIQDLRMRLKAYFGIQDDPIILEDGYKPKFKVSSSECPGRSVYAFSNNDLFDGKEDD